MRQPLLKTFQKCMCPCGPLDTNVAASLLSTRVVRKTSLFTDQSAPLSTRVIQDTHSNINEVISTSNTAQLNKHFATWIFFHPNFDKFHIVIPNPKTVLSIRSHFYRAA